MDTDAMRAWVETHYPDGNHLTVLYLDALADLDAVRADRLERGRALADLLALLDEHECVDPAVERARALVGHIERKVS